MPISANKTIKNTIKIYNRIFLGLTCHFYKLCWHQGPLAGGGQGGIERGRNACSLHYYCHRPLYSTGSPMWWPIQKDEIRGSSGHVKGQKCPTPHTLLLPIIPSHRVSHRKSHVGGAKQGNRKEIRGCRTEREGKGERHRGQGRHTDRDGTGWDCAQHRTHHLRLPSPQLTDCHCHCHCLSLTHTHTGEKGVWMNAVCMCTDTRACIHTHITLGTASII